MEVLFYLCPSVSICGSTALFRINLEKQMEPRNTRTTRKRMSLRPRGHSASGRAAPWADPSLLSCVSYYYPGEFSRAGEIFLPHSSRPLPARDERGEGQGEGRFQQVLLLSPALSSIGLRRGSPFGCGSAALCSSVVQLLFLGSTTDGHRWTQITD